MKPSSRMSAITMLVMLMLIMSACQGPAASPTPAAAKPATTAAQSSPAATTAPAATKPAATAAATTAAKSTSAPAKASIDACSLLTPAEVQAVVGKAVTPQVDSSDPRGLGCSYHDATTKSRLVSYAVYPLTPAGAKDVHEATKGGGRDQVTVPGIGDDAYFDKTFSSLNVLKGGYAVSLSVSPLDSNDPLKAAQALVPQLLSKLP